MNAEYQKQIVKKLSYVSDWMISELDNLSENYWENHRKFIFNSVTESLQTIATYHPDLAEKLMIFSIDPWLYNQYNKSLLFFNDPFIPQEIGLEIRDFYFDRTCKMGDALETVSEKFRMKLLRGKLKATNDELQSCFWIDLCKEYERNGVGMDSAHEKVISMLEDIRKYLIELS